jgi:hypothetical protein
MSYPAQPTQAELERPAAQETVTLVEDWPFNHLHFDRRARTWFGHVHEASEALQRTDHSGSPEQRCA